MSWSKNKQGRIFTGKKFGEIMLLLGVFIGAVWGYKECWGLADDNYGTKIIRQRESVATPAAEFSQITVSVQLKSGELLTQELEEYVADVIAAEMPANFPMEALKAQAVAARSYCLHYLTNNAYIPAGTIAQDWLSEEEQKKRWGENYTLNQQKIATAVAETKGQVLYWQDNIIVAAYHASCGGSRTAAAEEIWGSNVSYLASVSCPHGDEKFKEIEHIFRKEEIAQALNISQVKKIKVNAQTASGRVATVKIDGNIYDAAKIKTALSLPSTIFTIKEKGEEVVFTSSGSGHGVGMCQYGARYYADKGWDYQSILAHFYPNTTLGVV